MQVQGTLREKVLHRAFQVGIWVKGFDGVLELVGALFLLFGSPSWLSHEIVRIAQHAFHRDPGNFVANGFVKVLIAIGILRGKLWCYPVGITVIGILILLQSIRLVFHFSHILLVGTIIDIIIVILIMREYHHARKANVTAG